MNETIRQRYIRKLKELLNDKAMEIVHEAFFSEGEIKEILELLEGNDWTPCSPETMPDERQIVLISLKEKPIPFAKNIDFVRFAWREKDARSGKMYWLGRSFERYNDDDVLAWKPAPRMYKSNEK